jgi:hypothetical protein
MINYNNFRNIKSKLNVLIKRCVCKYILKNKTLNNSNGPNKVKLEFFQISQSSPINNSNIKYGINFAIFTNI